MQKRHSGFTLIEILIVVIILGILAAIVIPQFTNASDDAKLSSLQSTVQTVRSQIEMFKLQANSFPTAGANFFTVMESQSVADGKTVGPWLQASPVNPFTNGSAVKAGNSGNGDWCVANSKFYGYNPRTGSWIPAD